MVCRYSKMILCTSRLHSLLMTEKRLLKPPHGQFIQIPRICYCTDSPTSANDPALYVNFDKIELLWLTQCERDNTARIIMMKHDRFHGSTYASSGISVPGLIVSVRSVVLPWSVRQNLPQPTERWSRQRIQWRKWWSPARLVLIFRATMISSKVWSIAW